MDFSRELDKLETKAKQLEGAINGEIDSHNNNISSLTDTITQEHESIKTLQGHLARLAKHL